ncbi:glycosyltransferase family 8 protein, partial [Campylobacter coli]|nr:glycosyltransferase family 8 protein [Campylobacter coli]
MYHIIFSADENYIKYTSVLITSIIKNTNPKNHFQNRPYSFHILSNFVSEETREKLERLKKELSKIYPCEISIHIMSDDRFENFPSSGAAQNSKLPYYRLKFISLLDDNVDKCLYLDSDMLCMCDIREIFAIDLQGKIIGVVGDPGSKRSKIKFIENNTKKVLKFDENYFNSGFLLINAKEYKKANVEKKCEELAKKCIYIKAAD